jgi:hypothetical protein
LKRETIFGERELPTVMPGVALAAAEPTLPGNWRSPSR